MSVVTPVSEDCYDVSLNFCAMSQLSQGDSNKPAVMQKSALYSSLSSLRCAWSLTEPPVSVATLSFLLSSPVQAVTGRSWPGPGWSGWAHGHQHGEYYYDLHQTTVSSKHITCTCLFVQDQMLQILWHCHYFVTSTSCYQYGKFTIYWIEGGDSGIVSWL